MVLHKVLGKDCYLAHLYMSLNPTAWMVTTDISWLRRWIAQTRGGICMAYERAEPGGLEECLRLYKSQVEMTQDSKGSILIAAGLNNHFYVITGHRALSVGKHPATG